MKQHYPEHTSLLTPIAYHLAMRNFSKSTLDNIPTNQEIAELNTLNALQQIDIILQTQDCTTEKTQELLTNYLNAIEFMDTSNTNIKTTLFVKRKNIEQIKQTYQELQSTIDETDMYDVEKHLKIRAAIQAYQHTFVSTSPTHFSLESDIKFLAQLTKETLLFKEEICAHIKERSTPEHFEKNKLLLAQAHTLIDKHDFSSVSQQHIKKIIQPIQQQEDLVQYKKNTLHHELLQHTKRYETPIVTKRTHGTKVVIFHDEDNDLLEDSAETNPASSPSGPGLSILIKDEYIEI